MDAAKVAAAVSSLKHDHANALDPKTTGAELRNKASALAASLSPAERRAVLTQLGYRDTTRTDAEVLRALGGHAADRRATFDRSDA